MELFGTIFQIIFTQPITNLLVGFHQIFNSIGLPYALGFSIIALTIFIRIVLYPVVSAQIKSSKKMQELSPEMAEIRKKFKSDRTKQQEEMMKLYKKYNINPASGCLPAIIQMPIIFSLYHVLITIVAVNSLEKFVNEVRPLLYFDFLNITNLWNTSFFGLSLLSKPSEVFASNPLIILIPIITGFFQLILSKMMMSQKAQPANSKDDFQSTFMKQSLFIFPVMIGFFSFTLPVGLSLYWNTYTIFGILQQYLLVGFGGLTQWVPALKKYDRS